MDFLRLMAFRTTDEETAEIDRAAALRHFRSRSEFLRTIVLREVRRLLKKERTA